MEQRKVRTMGIGDVFKASENKKLKDRIAELENMLTPEQQQAEFMKRKIADLESEIFDKQNEVQKLQSEIIKRNAIISELDNEINKKRAESVSFDELLMLESFGLYKPRFDFAKSEEYKAKLEQCRKEQKEMIKNGNAALGASNWTVNGNVSQGKKMVKDMQKLLLRAFNNECDTVIEKVKYNNYDVSFNRICSSAEAIGKLGSMMGVSISDIYVGLKLFELELAFEYSQKKQAEKEAEKEERARLREEAKLQKEIEEARKKLEKEQTHYMNALAQLNLQLSNNPTSSDLLQKKAELEIKIADAEKAIKDVDYREANKRAGYVYVISNIGAFGENIYKIGMTRRLDPQERVDELGDASVPFTFDVHAMIFSDDAPKLEAALHKAFEDKKVNMVNPRREFFNVSLDEIKEVIRKNYDKTVEFTDYPQAEQYRVSLKMQNKTQLVAPVKPKIENIEPKTVQQPEIVNNIFTIEQLRNILKNFECVEEDTTESMKIHIYSSNRKVAIVKIQKSNSTILFRKIGTPQSYDLKSVDEVKKYLNEI